jgi:hypothetical protein
MPNVQSHSTNHDETDDEQIDGGLFPLKRNYYQGWMEPTGGQ